MLELIIDGEEPNVSGKHCEEVLAVTYWHAGELTEEVNSAHLKIDGRWIRLFFDHGIVFWRRDSGRPEPYEAPELNSRYSVTDIGQKENLRGQVLSGISTSPTAHGARVAFDFENGRTLVFEDEHDRSRYAC